MATDTVIVAAKRLRNELQNAKDGNYYTTAWYSYMSRDDVEALVLDVLGPEVVEPVIRVQVCKPDGTVLYETETTASALKFKPNPDGSAEVEFPMPADGWQTAGAGAALLTADVPNDDVDAWLGGHFDADEQVYVTGEGQTITNVHSAAQCADRPCAIHGPSDHHMRSWPTNWRDGGPYDIKGPHMERICPHGIGHPDPDDLAFHLSRGQDYSVHGCDGCCRVTSSSDLHSEW